jgi:hypothetical protein
MHRHRPRSHGDGPGSGTAAAGDKQMDDIEIRVTWKGKKAKMVLREEDDGINGYIAGKTRVLSLEVDDSEDEVTTTETFRHDDLECDSDEVSEAVIDALAEDEEDEEEDEDEDEDEEDEEDEDEDDEEDEEDDEEDEDEEEDDDEDEDEDEEEEGDEGEGEEATVDEDKDADYGEAIENAERAGVPTLHAVMVAYGAGIDVDADIRTMRKLLRRLQDQKIVNVAEELLHGAEATGQGALDAIAALEPERDDIVWFCYSGHGCMEEGDRLLNTHGKMLRRDAVVEAVTAKSARLHLVLSDCCAVEIGRVAPQDKMGASPGAPSENLRKLFRDYEGVFDVSSSDSYQYSFGGVFTPTLIDQVLLRNTPDTWEAVFEKTQKITMASADGALPADAKKKLRKEGKKAEDKQKPVAFTLPRRV